MLFNNQLRSNTNCLVRAKLNAGDVLLTLLPYPVSLQFSSFYLVTTEAGLTAAIICLISNKQCYLAGGGYCVTGARSHYSCLSRQSGIH